MGSWSLPVGDREMKSWVGVARSQARASMPRRKALPYEGRSSQSWSVERRSRVGGGRVLIWEYSSSALSEQLPAMSERLH